MIDHLVDGDGNGARISGNDVAEGIADEYNIDVGLLDDPRERVVVTGYHRYRRFAFFACFELINGEPFWFLDVRCAAHRGTPSDMME